MCCGFISRIFPYVSTFLLIGSSILAISTKDIGWFHKDDKYNGYFILNMGVSQWSWDHSNESTNYDLPDVFQPSSKSAFDLACFSLAVTVISLLLSIQNKRISVTTSPKLKKFCAFGGPVLSGTGGGCLIYGVVYYMVVVLTDYDEVDGLDEMFGQPDVFYVPYVCLFCATLSLFGSALLLHRNGKEIFETLESQSSTNNGTIPYVPV